MILPSLVLLRRIARSASGLTPAAVLLGAAASGQSPPLIPPELEAAPTRVESLGLTIYPPVGAIVDTDRVDERTILSLLDGSANPSWSLKVQPLLPSTGTLPGSTPAGSTPAAYVADILETFERGGAVFSVRENRPATYAGLPGHLCYVEHRSTQSSTQATPAPAITSGWLFLDRGESEYLVFASQILPEAFPRVRPLLESCFRNIVVDRFADVALSRKARLDAGRDFLASATPDRLRALIGPTRWYRYHRPAAVAGDADIELGYYAVECSEGPLGAIDASRAPSRYDKSEATRGLLVAVRGHYLEAATESSYDTQAFYWVAWDLSEEGWSVRGTRRYRGHTQSEAETGIRTPRSVGDPMGTVTVIASGASGGMRDQQSWRTPEEAYLSQALRWKLGQLLPRDYRLARAISTYAFDSTAPRMTIALRTDRWEPLADGSNGWKLTSKVRDDAPEIVSFYDADGTLRRRMHPGGNVTSAIALDDLHRLWKSKGLTTERMQR